MIKLPGIIFLAFFQTTAYSQDSLKLFYLNKVTNSKSDSLNLSECRKIIYKGTTVEINLFRNNEIINKFYAEASDFRFWKDSVFFSFNVSRSLYENIDSIAVHPLHHLVCEGRNGNRGPEKVEMEGSGNVIRNIDIKFYSNPPGAVVYLIPKLIWERTPRLIKNDILLNRYRVYSGITPVWSKVQEYVYIALFRYNNKYRIIECRPTHFNPVDSVYADFLIR